MKDVIGSQTTVSLPELGLSGLGVKIDTGAKYCSLHCSEVELLNDDAGERVRYKLLDPEHPEYNGVWHETSNYEVVRIKSSNGHIQLRYMVTLDTELNNRHYAVRYTLADRRSMRLPILMGRDFLHGRFVVDVELDPLHH